MPAQFPIPRALIASAVLVMQAACGTDPAPPVPKRPNVLLITLDTTRADRVGGPHSLTPALDSLAAGGVRFDNAYASTPLTLPSHTVLLTGTEPLFNGVRNNGSYQASPDLDTMAEGLSAAGYHTMAVLGAVVLDARYGLDQGFEIYDEVGAGDEGSEGERSAAEVVSRATALVQSAPEPWFLWVHCFDPHWPYAAPEPWAGQHEHPYDAEVAYTDAQLTPLLEAAADSLVIVTADHGESLGEHGERTHGLFVHDATTRVPLLMRWPGHLPTGARAAGVARLLDVFPTVQDLLGLPTPAAVQGRSLRAHWEQSAEPDSPVYAESMMPAENLGLAPVTALLVGERRLVHTTRDRLFDRAADPNEERDVAAELPDAVSTLVLSLAHYQTTHAGPLTQQGPTEVDEQTRQRLEALGYIHAPQGSTDGADPYEQLDFIDVVGNLDEDPADRVEALWALLQQRPEATHIWSFLIQAAFRAESPRFAHFVEAAAQAQPDSFELQANHAWLLAGRDDPQAPTALAHAMTLHQDQQAVGRLATPSAVKDLARAALKLGAAPHALTLLDSLRDQPLDADLRFNRALLRQQAQRFDAAQRDYRALLQDRDDDLDAWINLATCLVMLDQPQPALDAMEHAIALAPQRSDLQARKAQLQEGMGIPADPAR